MNPDSTKTDPTNDGVAMGSGKQKELERDECRIGVKAGYLEVFPQLQPDVQQGG